MNSLLPRLLRALAFGAVATVLLMGTLDLAIRLGFWVVLLPFAAFSLLAFLHAQEQAMVQEYLKTPVRSMGAVSRWLSGVSPPPATPQMVPSYDALISLRASHRSPETLHPRVDARLCLACRSNDLKKVSSAVQEMKQNGWWEYYAPRVWSEFGSPRSDVLRFLLKEGAIVARYNLQYEPIVFTALEASPSRGVCELLLDDLIALGASVEDCDLEDRNLLEKHIEGLPSVPYTHLNLADRACVATDLRQLWLRLQKISAEHLAKLRAHVSTVGGEPRQKLIDLVDEIEACQQHTILAELTPTPQSSSQRRL